MLQSYPFTGYYTFMIYDLGPISFSLDIYLSYNTAYIQFILGFIMHDVTLNFDLLE